MKATIDRHLEKYLGPIAKGWSSADHSSNVQVCLFAEQPSAGVMTFSTLGLSNHQLAMPGNRSVRQELLLATHRRFGSDELSKLLLQVAVSLVSEHRALLRGGIVSLGYPLGQGSACCHLYVSLPVVFPEGLATSHDTQPATVFAWLIPITENEATVVKTKGWSRFEDELERMDIDLFDLNRASIE